MKISPYTSYRKVTLPWLKEVPAHWLNSRIKFSTYVKGRVGWHGLNSSEFLTEGEFYLITGTEFIKKEVHWNKCYRISEERYEEDPYIQLKENDLLITKDGTIGKLAIVKNLPGKSSVNSGVFVTRPLRKEYDTNFMYYILSSQLFTEFININKTGTTINHLYQETFENFEYFFPPTIDEQQTITTFLDMKTAQVDNLIAEKEKLLKLLEEKRIAIITHAVTKGLDADVKMKPSGIDWLGDIPEHWDIRKVNHLFETIGSGTTPKSDNIEYYDGDIPWVTTSELREEEIFDTVNKLTDLALVDYSTLRYYNVGSVAIAMYGATIGRLGIFRIKATVNQACCVFDKSDDIFNKYFYYWLLMAKPVLISLSSGGGQPNLNQEQLKQIRITCPGMKEQLEIVEYLDTKIKYSIELENSVKSAIEKLKEYRISLITSAVTGKIDVRNFVQEPGNEKVH